MKKSALTMLIALSVASTYTLAGPATHTVSQSTIDTTSANATANASAAQDTTDSTS